MVSLVEDGDLHGVELHDALLHEVFESARAASATGEFAREAGHERDRERECLPGSSLAAAEDIATLKRRRERGDLNGEGVGFAELREGVHETGGDAELREANFGGRVEGDLFVHCCAFPTLCPQKRNAQQLCRSVRLGSG